MGRYSRRTQVVFKAIYLRFQYPSQGFTGLKRPSTLACLPASELNDENATSLVAVNLKIILARSW